MDSPFEELVKRSVKFQVDGKTYTLSEASESANIRFRTSQMRNARLVDGKLSADVERMIESQALLVSLCTVGEDGKTVQPGLVQGWPSRLVKQLFRWVQDNSDLEEKDTAESLEKKIEKDQQRLDQLRNGHTESEAKNAPAAATE